MTQQEEWLRDAVAKGQADHEAGRYVELVTDQNWDEFAAGIKRRGRERLEWKGRACLDAAEQGLRRRRRENWTRFGNVFKARAASPGPTLSSTASSPAADSWRTRPRSAGQCVG